MWTTLFLILIASAYGERLDGVYPKNIAAITGEPMWFICGTPSNKEIIIWKVKKIGRFVEELVSNGSYIAKAYRAENFSIGQSTTGNSLLSKNYAELDDAGTYKCIRTASGSESVIGIGTAQLIVFGSKPECRASSTNIQEGEYLRLSCNMSYIGSFNPVTECSGIDGIHREFPTNFNDPGNVTVFTKNHMLPSDNGRNVTCTTYFETPGPIDNRSDAQKADNAPGFRHQWIYRTEVLFSPKSVEINPRKESYVNGEVIRCIADGNPIPVYAWKETGSGAVVSNISTLVLNEITMHGRTYECTATNTRGSLPKSVTIRILESSSIRGMNSINVVTVVAGLLCAVLFIVVIAITLKRIAESCKSSSEREFATGPDIVQHAEEFDPMQEEQPFDGYARPEDLGRERRFIRYAGNGVASEARGEVLLPNCARAVMPDGNPIYDEINSEFKAAGTQAEKSGREFPVYGKVNKPSKEPTGTTSIPSEEFPVNRKVDKKASDKMQDFVESCNTLSRVFNPDEAEESKAPELFENSESLRRVIVGADGTEYLDLRAVRSLMQPETQTSPQSPKFTRSEYAQIDHSHTS